MSAITIIRQGGDLPFVFDRDGADLTDFVCTISVKDFPANTSQITPRVIEAVGREWPGMLSSAETSLMAVGSYNLIAIITNSITDEERQVPERFNITVPWA